VVVVRKVSNAFTYRAINRSTVAGIQEKVIEKCGRNLLSRLANAKNDKETITAWKLDLNRILHVFNVRSAMAAWPSLTVHSQTELAINTHHGVVNTQVMVSEIHRSVVKGQGGTDNQHQSVGDVCTPFHHHVNKRLPPLRHMPGQRSRISMGQCLIPSSSITGESPPPPPRDFFGRDELIEKLVGLAENITPFALIGTGGIGKTSIALTVLHEDRVKQRFGDNRRFIRCDQFPTSLTHFLRRLSKAIGASAENPEDLTPLRPFLSSKEMLVILDNVESILDPQGTDAQEIYAAVEELSQFDNICLGITSRISTVPPACETLDIPTLSVDAGHDIFYRIYKNGKRSDPRVNDILNQLDFHPLSITLLATVAHHNRWDADQLTKEWERQRTDVLRTHHKKSLAATIELSLASPMFQELGPNARELLGVIAFLPQGVDENNLEWLFPTISNGANIFNEFHVLSLTYRNNGFITMLAPLRDHLRPKDPELSPLLCAAKERYFVRLSVGVYPGKPGYEEARWIQSEDLNVEHLLDVFTTTDTDLNGVWDVCSYFMEHLNCHKPRLVMLGPRIEALPDAHPSKPRCLYWLSQLFSMVGNFTEHKRLLIYTLKLWRERGDESEVARTLRGLSGANRVLGLHEEAMQQVRGALEIYERLNNTVGRACSLRVLACLLYDNQQLDAAEEAASLSINLLPNKVNQPLVCQCRRILGRIHSSKGETEKAIDHFEAALRIASSLDWNHEQFWDHCGLAVLFSEQGRFDDSHAHIERAKSHAVNDWLLAGRAMDLHAQFWYHQRRFREAMSEALSAIDTYEKIGDMRSLEKSRGFLRDIEEAMEELTTSGEPDSDGELLDIVPLATRVIITFLFQFREPDDTVGGRPDI